ncbi:MAG TPA: tannase/feruloyl esterase family alpha/beta hydrolase [Alphaproteobacteria bacterium]|nr:tannase/feruloyl esterase family alpha/beta hydrolase [Alphaproteobacteria bacterium]
MKRGMFVSLAIGLGVTFGLSLSGQASAAGMSCSGLKNASFKNTRIEMAEEVNPSPTWDFPPSIFDALARTDPTGTLSVKEKFCRVVAVIGKEIKFELWLPDNWNGKYQQVGNGGYTGAINYPTMGGALAKGYATASTNLGHDSKNAFSTAWMVGHKQRVINFGYLAHHLVSVVSKEMVDKYYGKKPARSYFVGCSSGGWQALTEIQKYPDDFDGVVAGAPAHNFVRLNLRSTVVGEMSLHNPAGDLSAAQTKMIAADALKRCDPEDGVKDGLMSDPMQCDFDPRQLECKAGEKSDSCLTPAQVTRARELYGPIKSKGGIQLYPGPTIAAALAPSRPVKASAPALAAPLADALHEFGYTKKLTLGSFDADKDIPEMDKLMGPVMSSMNPDISKFKAHGGKVVAWQGWGDPAISPYNTLHYYGMVEKKTHANMDDFYRIFFVPGMGHCGAGATGPDKFDMVAALENWVEKGVAPTRVEAAQYTDGKVSRTRPLCMYPEVAKYTGSGSTDDAKNFKCVKP